MSILAIDTATEILSVGLETDGGSHFETSIAAGLRHSEYLLPVVDALLGIAHAEAHLSLICCMRGPGSFTGLRIGMATAKGLAAGSRCPLVAVPTLDVLAEGYDYLPGVVVPVIDARKRRVYTAIFEHGRKTSDDLDLTPTDLADRLDPESPVLFTGPGAHLLAGEAESKPRWRIDPHRSASRARALLELGKRQFEERGGDPDDVGPVYLRESEAVLGRRKSERAKNG